MSRPEKRLPVTLAGTIIGASILACAGALVGGYLGITMGPGWPQWPESTVHPGAMIMGVAGQAFACIVVLVLGAMIGWILGTLGGAMIGAVGGSIVALCRRWR
jgi:hypothetical protein